MIYAELILPLDLKENYHYRLDDDSLLNLPNAQELVGRRATVSFGSKRFYTGLIRRLSQTLPPNVEAKLIKDIESIIDPKPILTEEDFLFWEWLADYYQCSIGQVMRAVLPKGLVPESQTLIRLNEDFVASEQMPKLDYQILDILSQEKKKELSLTSLRNRLGRVASSAFDRLLRQGAVLTEESVQKRYKPKMKRYIRLSEGYCDDEALSELMDGELKRTKKQQELLLDFIAELEAKAGKSDFDYTAYSIERASFAKGKRTRPAHIKALIDKGILVEFEQAVSRLNNEEKIQIDKEYLEQIEGYQKQSLNQGVHYLYTGNSQHKEDFFIAQIAHTLSLGKQVLVLRPNTYEARSQRSFYSKLHKAIEEPIYYYDTFVSEPKRCELALTINNKDKAFLVVGGRNAIFLPMNNLGLIIVDEEQEYLYKQQFRQPLYHSRDVALWLAHRRSIPILLSSETPSAESLFNILRGKYKLVNVDEKLQKKAPLKVSIESIDLRQQKKEGKLRYGQTISKALRDEIAVNLKAGRRVLILKNRRGYAPYVICNSCSEHIRCRNCDVSMNYHSSTRLLQCHYCGYQHPFPSACPSCQATSVDFYGKEQPALALVGYGTERVEEELKELFPKNKVLRIDSESLQTNKKQEEIREQLSSGTIDIIVGTQLIKGQSLWFDEEKPLGLMAVVQLDELLSYPDFRTEERAYQLLYQLLMRYSEAHQSTSDFQPKLLLQTNNPEQAFISRLKAFDYRQFIKGQLSERQILNFPPFCRISYITIKGFAEDSVEQTAQTLSQILRTYWSEFGRISEAQKPSIARIDKQYIRQITCRRPFQEPYKRERELFRQAVAELRQSYPESNRVRVLFDIDPL